MDQVSRPLVSVVVPTYQHAHFIEDCIQGILMQRNLASLEVLIGEDGSTDGTRAICERLAKENPLRIRLFLRDRKDVIHLSGQPTGRANLLGLINDAKGKYIAWCDGDDVWTDPDKLARQVAYMESHPNCSGTYHATRIIEQDGSSEGKLVREYLPDCLDVEGAMSTLSAFHPSSFVFRSAPFMHPLPNWTRKIASLDIALYALVAAEGGLARVEGTMSSYRKHKDAITTKAFYRGARYDQQRILLWLHVNRYFQYQYADRCEELFEHHWRHLLQQATPRVRIRYLGELILAVPGWFLRKPLFSIQRFMDALRP